MKRRLRVRADGSIWQAYYYQPPGTKDAIPLGSDLLLAKRKWAELEGAPAPAEGTVADIRGRHVKGDGKQTSPRTQSDRDAYWKQLEPVFGEVLMCDLQQPHMLAYFDARSAKSSAKKELAYLSVLCSWAQVRGLVATNPVTGTLRHMKVKGGRDRYVTDAELDAVKRHAHPIMQDYLDLLYLTGQHPCDIRGLDWTDLRDGHLHIRPDKLRNSTKIALRIAVVGELAAVVERIKTREVRNLAAMLCTPSGQRLKEFGWARSEFDRARKAAGADWQLMDLRAKAATDSKTMGQARKLLGHATEAMTAHYVRKHAGEVVQPIRRDNEPTGSK